LQISVFLVNYVFPRMLKLHKRQISDFLKISQYKKSTNVAFFGVRYSNILISRVVQFNENILKLKGEICRK